MNNFSFLRFFSYTLISILIIPLQLSLASQSIENTNAPQDVSISHSSPAPLRFLLTFDDGPSAVRPNNPTEKILDVLAKNPYQSDIKALFFTQTQASNGGGTQYGRSLLKRELNEGHLLAIHTATRGHSNHRFMKEEQLIASLQLGISDLTGIVGKAPNLVRPPFWSYDSRTLDIYHQHGLHVLLTDLSANDGVIYFINFSLRKRSNMRKLLLAIRERWRNNEMPMVDGVTPIIVTFHDINSYTARTLEEYLSILLDVAKELEMPVAEKAFYDNKDEIERAALARTVESTNIAPQKPSLWYRIWH